MDLYTHDFTFNLNGQFRRGEAEFNTDNKATVKIEKMTSSLYLPVISAFNNLIELLKEITENVDEITEIKIKKKEKKSEVTSNVKGENVV